MRLHQFLQIALTLLGERPQKSKVCIGRNEIAGSRNKRLHSHFSGLATVTLLFYCAAGEDVKQDSTPATKI